MTFDDFSFVCHAGSLVLCGQLEIFEHAPCWRAFLFIYEITVGNITTIQITFSLKLAFAAIKKMLNVSSS
jgi:hypothetical protein